MVQISSSDFYIVVDANIIYDLGSCRDGVKIDKSRCDYVSTAGRLFNRMKEPVKICIDTNGIIQQEYEASGIKKNAHLGSIFAELIQKRIIIVKPKLSPQDKKKLKIVGMKGSRDPVYVGVANTIKNRRIIVTRNSDFYDPKNPSRIGDSTTVMARHLKKGFKIFVKTAKQTLNEKEVCKS